MGAKYNVRDLRENTRNSIGRFAMGAICNMSNLQWGRIAIRPYCNSPLRRTQKNPYHARDAFLCIYTYVCERPDNTRVGANCN